MVADLPYPPAYSELDDAGWTVAPRRQPEPIYRCEGPCACTPISELASRYVRSTLTWKALVTNSGEYHHNSTEQYRLEESGWESNRLYTAFDDLSFDQLSALVSTLCVYTAHITDALTAAVEDHDGLAVPGMPTSIGSGGSNVFRALANLSSTGESSSRALRQILNHIGWHLGDLGDLADALPHNPIHDALTQLDAAHGVSGH